MIKKYSKDKWITPKLSLEDHDPLEYEDQSLTFNKEVKSDDKMSADELTNDPEELEQLEEKYKDSAKEAEDNPSTDSSSDSSSSDDSSSDDKDSTNDDPTSEDSSDEDKKDDKDEDKKEEDKDDTKENDDNKKDEDKDSSKEDTSTDTSDDKKEAATEAFFDKILGIHSSGGEDTVSLEERQDTIVNPFDEHLDNQILTEKLKTINRIQKTLVFRSHLSNEDYNTIIRKINQLIPNTRISIEEYNHETRSDLLTQLDKIKASLENNADADGAIVRFINSIVNKFRKGYPAYHKSCQLEGRSFMARHDILDMTNNDYYLDPREAVNNPGYLEKTIINIQNDILSDKRIQFIRLEKAIAVQVFNVPIEDKATWDEIVRVNDKARQVIQNKQIELRYKKKEIRGINITHDLDYLNALYQILWTIYSIALFLPKGSPVAD